MARASSTYILQGPRLRHPRRAVFACRRPRDQDCAPHGTTVGQRQSRAAPRRGRRLPAHGRLPQAGDGRAAARAWGASSTWGSPARSSWPSGILLILLGVLRLLQTETGTALNGDWSWVPYAVVVVLGIAVIAVAAWRITAGTGPAEAARGRSPGASRERPRYSEDRRERADARHDHQGGEQRAPHHAGGPAGRVRAGDGRGRGHGPRRRTPGAGRRRRRRASCSSRWPSWPAGGGAGPSRPSSRSGGSDVDLLLRRFLRAGVRRGAGRELVLVPPRRCHLLPPPGPERPGERRLDASPSRRASRCSSRCATATPLRAVEA